MTIAWQFEYFSEKDPPRKSKFSVWRNDIYTLSIYSKEGRYIGQIMGQFDWVCSALKGVQWAIKWYPLSCPRISQ